MTRAETPRFKRTRFALAAGTLLAVAACGPDRAPTDGPTPNPSPNQAPVAEATYTRPTETRRTTQPSVIEVYSASLPEQPKVPFPNETSETNRVSARDFLKFKTTQANRIRRDVEDNDAHTTTTEGNVVTSTLSVTSEEGSYNLDVTYAKPKEGSDLRPDAVHSFSALYYDGIPTNGKDPQRPSEHSIFATFTGEAFTVTMNSDVAGAGTYSKESTNVEGNVVDGSVAGTETSYYTGIAEPTSEPFSNDTLSAFNGQLTTMLDRMHK